jgi:hypothetical protein
MTALSEDEQVSRERVQPTSCELVQVDPFAFRDVRSRIADNPITKLDELPPHRWATVYCLPSSPAGSTLMKI